MRKTERDDERVVPARPINPPAPREGDHLRDRAATEQERPGGQAVDEARASEFQRPDANATRTGEHRADDGAAHRTEHRADHGAAGSGADHGAAGSGQEERLFAAQDAEELRERWHRVQGGFVDDPRLAVEEADKLLVEAMKTLAERKRSLEGWREGGPETEDLRQALRGYRAFLDRLLKV